jgi:CheY-like chemotaxis protein
MKKILIIEDDNVVAGIYRNKLLHSGYNVKVANDGEAGLEDLETFKPDLVQLDLLMPKLNGVAVIKQIRARPEYRDLPIIVLSNSYVTRLVEEAWREGATLCLSKSECTPKVLLEKIEHLLAQVDSAKPIPPAPAPVLAAPTPPPTVSGQTSGAVIPATDAAFQASLRRMFLDSVPQTITGLRNHLQLVVKSASNTERMAALDELFRRVRSLTSNAGVAGLDKVAGISAAFEALLKELADIPGNISPSTLRTCALVVDVLAMLLERGEQAQQSKPLASLVLVVDDEPISRKATVYGLAKASLRCISLGDPLLALQVATENRFDLVFLDVDMPGMNGFELCQKLRALPSYQKTPIIFVTSYGDFESRAKSTLSGGNDLIIKPFLYMELAVKALATLLKSQMSAEQS